MTRRLLLLLTAAAAAAAAAAGGEAAPEYVGCFRDSMEPSERALGLSLFLDDAMSPRWCAEACGRTGQPLAGVQYGNECWCGRTHDRHGAAVPDEECAMPCAGDAAASCGGELRLGVYRSVAAGAAPAAPGAGEDAERPLLALVMIVKDEAHTLERTLMPLRPYLDAYYVLDTGSTDGTQDLVRRTLGEGLGEVWEEPFVDYGASRNRVLEIAERAARPPVFCLMLSADETVYNAAELRRFLEERRHSKGPQHEAYSVVMDVGWRFDSVRVSRTDSQWRYVGRVHEYLAPPDRSARDTLRVPGAYIKFKATDAERRGQREYRIMAILEEDRANNPDDPRTAFYLARTYNAVGNHSAALAEFERRVSLGGWAEEVYESLYAMAWQKKELGRPWGEVQQQLIEAHLQSPGRAEPLYDVADHYLVRGEFSLAFTFALRASQLEYPSGAALWVQEEVYTWQARYVLAQSGVQDSVRQYEIGARALAEALLVKPDNVYLLAREPEYREKMGDAAVDAIFRQAREAAAGGAEASEASPREEAAPQNARAAAGGAPQDARREPSPPPPPPARDAAGGDGGDGAADEAWWDAQAATLGGVMFAGVVMGGASCYGLMALLEGPRHSKEA